MMLQKFGSQYMRGVLYTYLSQSPSTYAFVTCTKSLLSDIIKSVREVFGRISVNVRRKEGLILQRLFWNVVLAQNIIHVKYAINTYMWITALCSNSLI